MRHEDAAPTAYLAQGGRHENGRSTWGQSLLADPWGTLLAQLPSAAREKAMAEALREAYDWMPMAYRIDLVENHADALRDEPDVIFAIVGEELGLLGAATLIVLYVLLTLALIRVLRNTDRLFEQYLMYGIVSWIAIQSLINIGVVLNFLPVLGVPLPLISSGGTSLLATLFTLGIALGVERRNATRPATISNRSRMRAV